MRIGQCVVNRTQDGFPFPGKGFRDSEGLWRWVKQILGRYNSKEYLDILDPELSLRAM